MGPRPPNWAGGVETLPSAKKDGGRAPYSRGRGAEKLQKGAIRIHASDTAARCGTAQWGTAERACCALCCAALRSTALRCCATLRRAVPPPRHCLPKPPPRRALHPAIGLPVCPRTLTTARRIGSVGLSVSLRLCLLQGVQYGVQGIKVHLPLDDLISDDPGGEGTDGDGLTGGIQLNTLGGVGKEGGEEGGERGRERGLQRGMRKWLARRYWQHPAGHSGGWVGRNTGG